MSKGRSEHAAENMIVVFRPGQSVGSSIHRRLRGLIIRQLMSLVEPSRKLMSLAQLSVEFHRPHVLVPWLANGDHAGRGSQGKGRFLMGLFVAAEPEGTILDEWSTGG